MTFEIIAPLVDIVTLLSPTTCVCLINLPYSNLVLFHIKMFNLYPHLTLHPIHQIPSDGYYLFAHILKGQKGKIYSADFIYFAHETKPIGYYWAHTFLHK